MVRCFDLFRFSQTTTHLKHNMSAEMLYGDCRARILGGTDVLSLEQMIKPFQSLFHHSCAKEGGVLHKSKTCCLHNSPPPPPLNIWRLNPPALFLKPVPLHAVNTCIGATLTQKVELISVKVADSTSGAAGMMECTALRGRVSLSSTRQVLGSSFVAPRSFQ